MKYTATNSVSMSESGFLSCVEIVPRLESAATYDELEEILSLMDYKMSLDEWIDSL